MIGHLGSRVSELLDGQLTLEEEDRAWAHVHGCHACRDLVEREGWVKTRLAGLAGPTAVPTGLAGLKGSLLDVSSRHAGAGPLTPGEAFLVDRDTGPRPRRAGLVALGGGAAGAAVMGVLALGAAPAQAPTLTPRPPVASVTTPSQATLVTPHRRLGTP